MSLVYNHTSSPVSESIGQESRSQMTEIQIRLDQPQVGNLGLNMGAKLLQSCLTLCDPMDCSPPGSSVHGILHAIILEWVAMPPPEDLTDPGIESESLLSPALAGRFFTTIATWEAPWVVQLGNYK